MKRLPIVAVSAFLLITVIVLGQTWWPEGSRPLQGDNQTKSTIKVNQILYDSQQGTKPLSVSGSFTGTVNTISNVSSTYAGQTARIDVNPTNDVYSTTLSNRLLSVETAVVAVSNLTWSLTQSLPQGTNKVGGFTSICKGAISNDTSASYGIGDVYAAVFTCTNAARTAGGAVTWQSFKLFTGDDAQFDFEVFLFTQIPTTLGLSNTVWAVSTSDLASYCCGKMTSLDFPNGWSDLGTNRMFVADFVKAACTAPGTNDLFMAIRTLSTAVQGTNQPSVRLGFWQD